MKKMVARRQLLDSAQSNCHRAETVTVDTDALMLAADAMTEPTTLLRSVHATASFRTLQILYQIINIFNSSDLKSLK
jgi:hypothetical protein